MAPKTPIPTSGTELEEMLGDPKVYAQVYADPETRAEFQRKYAAALLKGDPEFQARSCATPGAAGRRRVRDQGRRGRRARSALACR